MYIVWKFGEIRVSDTGVLDFRSCTEGIENATILEFAKWPLFIYLYSTHDRMGSQCKRCRELYIPTWSRPLART